MCVLIYHPCVIISSPGALSSHPVRCLLTRWVILSPGVLPYHPCVTLSPVCYLITRVLSHHPCVILSPVCYLITRVLSYHPCFILSPLCYLITRVLSCGLHGTTFPRKRGRENTLTPVGRDQLDVRPRTKSYAILVPLPQAVLSIIGYSPPLMRHAQHLMALRKAWCKRCLPGR